MNDSAILHETRTRLRLAVARDADIDAAREYLRSLPGVREVRANPTLHCLVVQHDGAALTRAAVLQGLRGASAQSRRQRGAVFGDGLAKRAAWTPFALAAAVPVLPRSLRGGAALASIAARIATQPERLRRDAPAVLLDASSLIALAISGQPGSVSAAVLLRWVSELMSTRMVRQADDLLDHLVPQEAGKYSALRDGADASAWSWWPLRALRSGDRVRLFPGDVVPLDGCIVAGTCTLAPAAADHAARSVAPGDHVAAGERLSEGTVEMRAEADAASSRLERMRAHIRHAIGARDPIGRLASNIERLVSLPVTAAAIVYAFTGDAARAAGMLHADPKKGLDLAVPLAREAALYALARRGLLASGLEAVDRLAAAHTLVLQDTGVLATGRWTIESVRTADGGEPEPVRRWFAAWADTPVDVLDRASFPDLLVRQWIRHGALLRDGDRELHLASPARLQRVWGLHLSDRPEQLASESDAALRRELAVVAQGRVVARVVLMSPLRPAAIEQLKTLAWLGFKRIAIFVEGDGSGDAEPAVVVPAAGLRRVVRVPDDRGLRTDWLADAMRDGAPLVMVHSVLRDLLPPGSVSLTVMDADAGSHGVLLGDPLASLIVARQLAIIVQRRLRLHQAGAVAANAGVMVSGALQWAPPMVTVVLHHVFAIALLLDSLRVESLASAPLQRPSPVQGRSDTSARHQGTIHDELMGETA